MLLGGNVRWKRKTDFSSVNLFSNNTGHARWNFGFDIHCFIMRQNIFLTDSVLEALELLTVSSALLPQHKYQELWLQQAHCTLLSWFELNMSLISASHSATAAGRRQLCLSCFAFCIQLLTPDTSALGPGCRRGARGVFQLKLFAITGSSQKDTWGRWTFSHFWRTFGSCFTVTFWYFIIFFFFGI